MSDYARELAERWSADPGTRSERMAIEGAVREALANAAQVADEYNGGRRIADAIRALGAKP